MTYAINPDRRQSPVKINDEDLLPIIDPRQNLRALTDAASILKDCGLDNVCIPDLKIAHDVSIQKYLIGSEDKLELTLNITNEGTWPMQPTCNVNKQLSFFKNVNKKLPFSKRKHTADIFQNVNKQLTWARVSN